MADRLLQSLNSSAVSLVLFVLCIITVALPAGLFFFISTLWTPRLSPTLRKLLDTTVRNMMALQTICALAYACVGWSNDTYDYLRSAEDWIWVDYFDGQIVKAVTDPSTETIPPIDLWGFMGNHWSGFYFQNCFTVILFLVLAVLCIPLHLLLQKLYSDLGILSLFCQLEFLIKVLQVTHLRLCISLFLEVRLLSDGKSMNWSSGLGLGISAITIFLLPIVQLAYLRLRQRGNLESEETLHVFGASYREYRNCWQVFHFHVSFVEDIGVALALCILGQWSNVQPFVLLALLFLSLIYTAAVRPYTLWVRNCEEIATKLFRLLICVLLVLVYKREEVGLHGDTESLVCFLLFLGWLICKLAAGVYLSVVSLRDVRGLFSLEKTDKKRASVEKTLGEMMKKTYSSDDSPKARRRSKKTADFAGAEPTGNEDGSARSDLVEIQTAAVPLDTKDEKEVLDPRLDRKSSARRRRKKKVAIPT